VRFMKHWVVSIPCNGQNSYEIVATAVGESWNLVLLSVTFEATCFANVCPLHVVLWDLMFHVTCHAVFETIAGQVAGQIALYIRT